MDRARGYIYISFNIMSVYIAYTHLYLFISISVYDKYHVISPSNLTLQIQTQHYSVYSVFFLFFVTSFLDSIIHNVFTYLIHLPVCFSFVCVFVSVLYVCVCVLLTQSVGDLLY